MAISFPLNHPTSPGFSTFEMLPISNVGITSSIFSFKQETQKHQGQIWGASVMLPPMNKDDALEWESFFLKLNGMEGTFLLGDPEGLTPRGVATGTPIVDGPSQTGNTLSTRGWDVSETNILRVGDYIQLGSGVNSLLHRVLNDSDSDVSGLASFDIWPDIRTPPNDRDPVVIISPRGLFRMTSNEMNFLINNVRHHIFAFSCVEVL